MCLITLLGLVSTRLTLRRGKTIQWELSPTPTSYDRLLTVEEIKEDIEGALLGVEPTGKLATVWDKKS